VIIENLVLAFAGAVLIFCHQRQRSVSNSDKVVIGLRFIVFNGFKWLMSKSDLN
jgi:hypothetical protein